MKAVGRFFRSIGIATGERGADGDTNSPSPK
jgi:hypothetical protein